MEHSSHLEREIILERGRGGEGGFSLIETLIAAALLLILTVFILPLFVNSMWSNVKGLDSTEMTHLSRSGVEDFWELEVGDEGFRFADALPEDIEDIPVDIPDIGGAASSQLVLSEQIWRRDALTPPNTPWQINHQAWVDGEAFDDNETDLFRRKIVVRQFSYSDISDGVIDAGGGGFLVPQGDPDIFDTPLDLAAADQHLHLRELEVEMESNRQSGSGVRRTRLIRFF